MSIFRPVYRQLTDDEKKLTDDIKDRAEELHQLIQKMPKSRHQSVAITKLEEAVMWAVKGVTA